MVSENHRARQEAIGAGICHFNKRGKHKHIDKFLENWSCLSDDEDSLIKTKIGVYGDSHSADKALSLKLNGYDVVQMGGAGCPLHPTIIDAKLKYCFRLMKRFNEIEDVDTVFLSNRFQDDELTVENLSIILSYWSQRFKSVVLFSPMPEFNGSHDLFIRTGHFHNNPSLSYHDKFFSLLKNIDIPNNVVIINTKVIFCGINRDCSGMKNGELLLTDYGHLTIFGAKEFGRALIQSTDWVW